MKKLLVFISHITTEKEIAVSFKQLVEEAFLGMIEVFVSSDPNSIAMGGRWLDNITYGLKNCVIEIVIASPTSVIRPWINFEAGAGWVRDISVIPLCHSGMTPSTLPAPLSSLQAALATDATHLERVFAVIAKAIDCKLPEVNYAPFVAAVEKFVETSQQIRDIAEKSPIADEAGLNPHEFATLAAIAEKAELPTSVVWPYAITNTMNEAGYRNIAATLGMAGLQRKGLIEAVEESTGGYSETAMVVRITNSGWTWLESNVGKLELRLPPDEPSSEAPIAEPVEDIPF
ncbi:MAG: toll/interleukin-1 receptor domain-containing protein [Pirellulales bacterium]